jgi:hypothetical protein
MNEDPLKQAFTRVKQDMNTLTQNFSIIKNEIDEIKRLLRALHIQINAQKIQELATSEPAKRQIEASTHSSTTMPINATDPASTTHNSTVRQEIGGLRYQNLGISIGNEGASTDRQTDTSTDRQTQGYTQKDLRTLNMVKNNTPTIEADINKASDILNSLDHLKKEIRFKFKRVTIQEMLVFSTIYQLEENDPRSANYKNIASIVHLSESSIRDYVQRMIQKGIPIRKNKINNKHICLSISDQLKKIASLDTIIRLREL